MHHACMLHNPLNASKVKMEGEMSNFIKVFAAAILSGCYCFSLSKSTQQTGLPRLLLLLPVIALFTTLPFSLSSFHLSAVTFYFLTWLSNSKLLLLSFGSGPLSRPGLSLLPFIFTLLIPVNFKILPSTESNPDPAAQLEGCAAKVGRYAMFWAKLMGFVLLIVPYSYKHVLPPVVLMGLHCAHICVALEMSLALSGVFARAALGPNLRFRPQFNQPYLSTSLQDFWGRRWNLVSSDILKQTVYDPIRGLGSPLIGKTLAMLVGVLASFLVSGLMHELMYYCVTRVSPTWEVTRYFVFLGVCTIVEVMVIKKAVSGKWRLHKAISTPLTIGFLVVTTIWLFFPPLLGNKVYEKTTDEYLIVANYLCKDKCSMLWFRNW